MKYGLVLLVPVIALMFVPAFVLAGDKYDWPETYDRLNDPQVFSCWENGFDDGQNDDFSQNRHDSCQFNVGQPYYEAFIIGCKNAGNSEDICESFTDD
jgi:hypothetical protein